MKGSGWVLNWQIAATYIGAVIGAGFASGQEIIQFFSKFGYWGMGGALLAGLLFAWLGCVVVSSAARQQMDSYEQYLVFLFGLGKAKIFDGLICLFLFSGLAVMLVAGGSLFNQLWGWEVRVGFIVNILFLYGVMLLGVKGMIWLNSLVIPFLLLFGLGVAMLGIISGGEIQTFPLVDNGLILDNWLLAAILYVSYNLVLAMVILVTLGKQVKKTGNSGVLVGGMVLGLFAGILGLALGMNAGITQGKDIPMLALAQALNPWIGKGYSLVLWVAIMTTALGNGIGLMRRLESSWPGARVLTAFVPFLPTLLFFGWSLERAVVVIYPLLGYLGLILLVAIILSSMSDKRYFY